MHFRSKKNCRPPLCDTATITIPPSICDYVVVMYGQPFTVILERGADQLVSQVKDILCIARLITAVKDLFSGRLPGRSQDLGTFLNFHICNSWLCHFRVGDILIFNSDHMIFLCGPFFVLLAKYNHLWVSQLLSGQQRSLWFLRRNCSHYMKTWPCAHCAVVEVDTEQDGSLGICEIYQCWAGGLSFPLWLLSSWCSCEVKSFECVNVAFLTQPNFRKWQGKYLCKKSYLAGILFWPRSATPAAISLAMWPIQKRFVLKGNVYPIKSAKRVECRLLLLLLLVTWTLFYHW